MYVISNKLNNDMEGSLLSTVANAPRGNCHIKLIFRAQYVRRKCTSVSEGALITRRAYLLCKLKE